MTRREFPSRVKVAAFKRADGFCEGCGTFLRPGRFAYDHRNPDGLTGEPTLDNCQVLCTVGEESCHAIKTRGDVAAIARAKRLEAAHVGAKAPPRRKIQSRGFPKAPPQNSATRKIEKRT